jgi:hypothetical protein
VALYFALRDGHENANKKYIRLWAFNAEAINARFKSVAFKGRSAELKRQGTPTSHRVSLSSVDAMTDRDLITTETQGLRDLIEESLWLPLHG